MKSLGRALVYLKGYWGLAAGAFLSLLISSGTRLAVPRLTQVIVDQGIQAHRLDVVARACAAMVIVTLARSVFSWLQGLLAAHTAQGIAYDLRNRLYPRVQSLSFSYHDQAQTGQLLTRVTSDVEMVYRFVGIGVV